MSFNIRAGDIVVIKNFIYGGREKSMYKLKVLTQP